LYLFTAQEMRDLDRYMMEEIGVPGAALMENAGRSVAQAILHRKLQGTFAVILAGSGNNGGDGFVAARYLASAGWDVNVWWIGSEEKMSEETRAFYQSCLKLGLSVRLYERSRAGELKEMLQRCDVVVDALLGTGVHGELREPLPELIRLVNLEAEQALKVAVDIPSGVNTDTGAIMTDAIKADVTVTLDSPKWCHYLRPAAEYCGELQVADIGIPSFAKAHQAPQARLNTPEMWKAYLKPRSPWGHKGSYGHLLVVGGSRGMLGAATLSGMAGLRAGAGLVTVAVPEQQEQAIAAKLTEALVWGWPGADGVFTASGSQVLGERADRLSAVAVGPGVGRFAGETEWLKEILARSPFPMVLDADALNILSEDPSMLHMRQHPTVLTPHPGEMARLAGCTVQEVEQNRHRIPREWAQFYGVTVVLKGTHTVIAMSDGRQVVNPTGSPALAKGGSGDILTGILGALLARKIPVHAAVPMGVYIHGLAGERAVSDSAHSVLATEVIDQIGPAIHQIS
jgi:ADP-dependent NAD(P)H-hydrate dehydratase / NAD(P)H-hydrate epimerase